MLCLGRVDRLCLVSTGVARNLLAKIVGREDPEKLRLIRAAPQLQEAEEKSDIPETSVVPALMNLCYGGSPEEGRIEEFLARSVATGQLDAAPDALYSTLVKNYFDVAERSQFSGFIIEAARRLYSRFVTLTRIIASGTALSDDVEVQLQLSRAWVRVKLLDMNHVLDPVPLKIIQTRPLDEVLPYLSHPDPNVRAYAQFTVASLRWHAGEVKPARKILEGHLDSCGPLYDECEFLLPKSSSRMMMGRL